MADVIYESYNIARRPMLFGDQVMLKAMFEKLGFAQHVSFMGLDSKIKGAVVNLSLFHNEEHIDMLNADIKRLDWVLLILTSNEFSSDAYKDIKHPNMKIWLQTPKESDKADRFIPIGFPTHIEPIESERIYDWFFAGQITNDTRRSCANALKKIPGGLLIETQGFNEGLPHEDYLLEMSRAKIVPCPAGPATPDSFRLYEALEMGCVPIVDNEWFWDKLFGICPFPSLDRWSAARGVIQDVLKDYEAYQSTIADWWKAFKQEYQDSLLADVKELRSKV